MSRACYGRSVDEQTIGDCTVRGLAAGRGVRQPWTSRFHRDAAGDVFDLAGGLRSCLGVTAIEHGGGAPEASGSIDACLDRSPSVGPWSNRIDRRPTRRRPLASFGPLALLDASSPATQLSPGASIP